MTKMTFDRSPPTTSGLTLQDLGPGHIFVFLTGQGGGDPFSPAIVTDEGRFVHLDNGMEYEREPRNTRPVKRVKSHLSWSVID